MNTEHSPSESVALTMLMILHYCIACLELIEKALFKLQPEEVFASLSSTLSAASSSSPASSPAPTPAPTRPLEPQQPSAEPVATIPNAEPTTSLSLQYPAVRHKLTVAAQAGHSAEVKALLTKLGATKLSEVEPAQYQTLLQEVEMLLKGQEVDGDA